MEPGSHRTLGLARSHGRRHAPGGGTVQTPIFDEAENRVIMEHGTQETWALSLIASTDVGTASFALEAPQPNPSLGAPTFGFSLAGD